jgi:hypothetical protein
MAAEAVAVTMIVVVSMVVAVAVAVVRMAGGFLGFLVHRLDSNRDLVWLTAGILGAYVVNNGAERDDRPERTRGPKRN